jgi:hypothetical protein
MRWVGFVACLGERRNVYRLVIGKLDVERHYGMCRYRWVDFITINIKVTVCEVVDLIQLTQDGVSGGLSLAP